MVGYAELLAMVPYSWPFLQDGAAIWECAAGVEISRTSGAGEAALLRPAGMRLGPSHPWTARFLNCTVQVIASLPWRVDGNPRQKIDLRSHGSDPQSFSSKGDVARLPLRLVIDRAY
jgi:hypothetical protein